MVQFVIIMLLSMKKSINDVTLRIIYTKSNYDDKSIGYCQQKNRFDDAR